MTTTPDDWIEDAVLLERWIAGDARAGDRLYVRHADAVIRFFANKVSLGFNLEVDELVQRTWQRLLERREHIEEGRVFRAYILGIARNVLLMQFRALQRERGFDPQVDAVVDSQPGVSSMFAERQEQRLLLEGLRRLPLDQQILLELFYWEGLKSYEIAEVLGTPEVPDSTIRGRIQKARQQLMARIAELGASSELIVSTVGNLDEWARSIHARRK